MGRGGEGWFRQVGARLGEAPQWSAKFPAEVLEEMVGGLGKEPEPLSKKLGGYRA